MPNEIELFCRVCGLLYEIPPWGESGEDPSFGICDCCGTEFGYEDHQLSSIIRKRKEWINNGCKWHRKRVKPPANWSAVESLKRIPDKYK